VLQSNIIFCDICCFRSASWRMSSLKGVVKFAFVTLSLRHKAINL